MTADAVAIASQGESAMSNAAPVRAMALRVTRTDACGAPVPEATANSRVTTAGFVSVGLASDVFTSSEVQVINAAGQPCVYSKGVPSLRGFNITIQLCNYNLAVLQLLGIIDILTDYAAPVEDVGGVLRPGAATETAMLEWWPGNGNNDACAAAGANPKRPYLHFVAPRVSQWSISGNLDFGDAASTITLQGYAQPSTAFAESKVADEWSVADVTSINTAPGTLLAFREVVNLPVTTAVGFDL